MFSHGRKICQVFICMVCSFSCGNKKDSKPDSSENQNLSNKNSTANEVLIDATNQENWVFYSLSQGVISPNPDPLGHDWDLAFKRYDIKMNGGVSGTKGLTAAVVDQKFDTAIVPENNFASDAPDGDDRGEDPDYFLSQWYSYNPTNHLLSPLEKTFFIRSGDSTYRFAVLSYYNDAGTPGHLRLTIVKEGL